VVDLIMGDVFSVHTDVRLLIAEVLEVAKDRNLLQVRLYPIEENRTIWVEDWRLDHTQEGFRKQIYRMVTGSGFRFFPHGSMTGRSSSASPSVTPADNFRQQAKAAARFPPPVPPNAQPVGTGALADSYLANVDYREIELRLAAWRTSEAEAAAKAYTEMEIPPGYNNHYSDGMMAHNNGVLPDQAPFHHLDQKVTLAWLRGWSKAREVFVEHEQKARQSGTAS